MAMKNIYCFLLTLVLIATKITSLASVAPNMDSFADVKKEDSIRRVRMAELFNKDDKEAFLVECRNLIEYHKKSGNEKFLFDAYATLFDRMQAWGRFDEAIEVLNEMSNCAQELKSDIGKAITEFCFGQLYLGNKNPKEAKIHHQKAFELLQSLGETARAIRSGFNLQAIAMNLNDIDEGLAINDSTEVLISKMESISGHRSIPNRFKQTRYRFVLYQRKGDLNNAKLLKDSLLKYAEILNDSSQEELVFTALAQYEQQFGSKEKAYSYLDTIIERNMRIKNYLKVAQFRQALADFQFDNGDLADAVVNYKLYATENDSARIHLTNEQLNELTKRYELNELKLKNQIVQQRLFWALFAILLLLALLIAIYFYTRSLKRKNKFLYESSIKIIKEDEEAEKALVENFSEEYTSEKKLYASFLKIMNEEELFKDPNLTVEQICAKLGTNRTYLGNSIKQCAQTTIAKFISQFRLRWAAEELVRNPNNPIMAVGEDAGFNSKATFNRLFKDQFGISPSSYRKVAVEK